VIESSNQWIEEQIGSPITAEATSPTVMFSYISQRNIQSMLGGNLAGRVVDFCNLGDCVEEFSLRMDQSYS
jgi:hypothetical protein